MDRISPNPARRSALKWMAVVATTLAFGAVSTASASLKGAAAADVEITLLHGTKGATSASPPGWPELSAPPFNAYNHYDVVSTKTLALKQGAVSKESLPDGSSFEATLIDVAPKVKLELVLKDSKGAQVSKGTYSASKGKKFLPVSTPYKGGSLVIGVKVL